MTFTLGQVIFIVFGLAEFFLLVYFASEMRRAVSGAAAAACFVFMLAIAAFTFLLYGGIYWW